MLFVTKLSIVLTEWRPYFRFSTMSGYVIIFEFKRVKIISMH